MASIPSPSTHAGQAVPAGGTGRKNKLPFPMAPLASLAACAAGVWLITAALTGTGLKQAAAVELSVDATETEVYWPTDRATGKLRQLGEYAREFERFPYLFDLADLPNGQAPDGSVMPNGTDVVNANEAADLAYEQGWCLLDARKLADIRDKGTIPGAEFYEFKLTGVEAKHNQQLTQAVAKDLLERYSGIVVFCNGPTCRRSYNAAVVMVEEWGIDPERVAWYRAGVPAWDATPLLHVDLSKREIGRRVAR